VGHVADVAVLGAGTMGSGIAEVAARAGHQVQLFDLRAETARRALDQIGRNLARDVARGRLEAADAAATVARIHLASAVADLAGVGVVVEAVTEDLAVKRELLAEVEKVVTQGDEDVVLATTTSLLSVTALATGLQRPGLLVGLHLFTPAPRTALVEVVQGEDSEPAVVEAAVELTRAWGKTPVLCRSTPGFVVNRIARSFFGEAQRVVELRAADAATVDAILREAGGFPLGAFQLADLVGQDVDLAVTRSVWERTFHDPRYAPTVLQQRLVDAGRLGRRTGRGVYGYAPDGEVRDALALTAPHRPAPVHVQLVDYEFGPMAPFVDRIERGGVEIERIALSDSEALEELPGLRLPGEGLLRVTDGSTARSWAMEAPGGVVLLDWAHDPTTCRRVALMAPRDVEPVVLDAAIGLCQAAGVEVSVIADVAGGVVARTVSMLVNEAVDLVARGEASANDVDVAMLLGTGFPSGPLEWGDRVGAIRVASVLAELHEETPTGRYRVSPRLDEAVVAEENLRDL